MVRLSYGTFTFKTNNNDESSHRNKLKLFVCSRRIRLWGGLSTAEDQKALEPGPDSSCVANMNLERGIRNLQSVETSVIISRMKINEVER